MNINTIKQQKKERRHRRIRTKISGTLERPRLSVYRSLKHFYAQLIDDTSGKTLVSVRDAEIKEGKTKTEKALALGKLLAQQAGEKNIKQAVFDKGAFKFHGRVKALADGAKEGGLKI